LPAYTLEEGAVDGVGLLRNEPVQARSNARLTALLDAAAAVVDEIGYERLTTAMVADRAGASIGTVYRYFPDRIVVLQGVSARLLQQLSDRMRAALDDPDNSTWQKALDAGFDAVVDSYRSVPGFRSLRFGDVLDIAPAAGARMGSALLAEIIAERLVQRFGATGDDLAFQIEAGIVSSDALLARAFFLDRSGDEAFIHEARVAAMGRYAGRFSD
jgi:AcrR family transcriptional regulator